MCRRGFRCRHHWRIVPCGRFPYNGSSEHGNESSRVSRTIIPPATWVGTVQHASLFLRLSLWSDSRRTRFYLKTEKPLTPSRALGAQSGGLINIRSQNPTTCWKWVRAATILSCRDKNRKASMFVSPCSGQWRLQICICRLVYIP